MMHSVRAPFSLASKLIYLQTRSGTVFSPFLASFPTAAHITPLLRSALDAEAEREESGTGDCEGAELSPCVADFPGNPRQNEVGLSAVNQGM